MRAIKIGVCAIVIVGLSGPVATRQQAKPPEKLAGMALGLKAPTDKAVDYAASSLEAAFKEVAAQKIYAFRILEGGTFNMNLRGQFAPEDVARVHTNIHDLYLVRSGEGTLVTGGELVDVKKGGAAGTELTGTIRNGASRVAKAGDVIFVPAGVPHQVTAVNGHFLFLLVRWQQK